MKLVIYTGRKSKRGMFWDKATIRKYNEVSGKWLRHRSDLW